MGVQINATSYAQMANSALKWNCHLPAHAKAQEQIQEALRLIPAEKHAEMLQVKEELDAVSREAAAADAAVAAVAKASHVFSHPGGISPTTQPRRICWKCGAVFSRS